ncbi:unnamed protein product [Urochloa decumbens]|uniref:Uncharacterized protein n=1 Tax=Urochloa decumbens TaxID=240449 RepID=A0ABC9EM21_9POAL
MGMAAAPHAPPHLHSHPLLLAGPRGRRPGLTSSRHHSSSSSASSGSPPPTNNKDLTQNNNVPGELNSAKAAASRPAAIYTACFLLYGGAAFMYFWVKPRVEELRNEVSALRRERSTLIKALEECHRTHSKAQDMLADSSQAQSIQALGISFMCHLFLLFLKLCSHFNIQTS